MAAKITTLKPEPTREQDPFSLARSIYNRRKTLREKADKLLDDAPPRVRAIVEGIEEEEASVPIPDLPSTPETE